MMVTFYKPSKKRHKIIIEADAFPSDIYAVESQIKHHNLSPANSLIKLRPRDGEYAIRTEDIQTIIYDIGMSLKFEPLKEWFTAFYQVILGQDQGPRLGSFIKFYGVKKTISLVKEKLGEN